MDETTYEALKNVMAYVSGWKTEVMKNDINQVMCWIDEVSKEYE